MSHVKAGGSVHQHAQSSRKGKCLGLKKSGGELVQVGHIIVRQRGAKYKAGKGVGHARHRHHRSRGGAGVSRSGEGCPWVSLR